MVPKGWREEKLGEVASTFAGGTPSRDIEEYFKGDIPWVKSGELNKTIIYKTEEKITSGALKNSSAKMAETGSVLVAMYGATAGVVGKLAIDAAINQAVLSVKAKPEHAVNEYLFYILSNLSKDLLNTSQGSGQPNLSKQLIDRAMIALPPLLEQKRIVEVLGGVDEAIDATKAVIEQTKKVKQGLLQTLLTKGIGHTKFKPSPLGEIPAEWEVKNMAEVCKLINGRAYKENELLAEGKYPVLRVGNFFTNNNWYFSDLELPEDKYCDKNDLLYAWSASFGPRIWHGGKVIFHYHIWKIEHHGDLIEKSYLYYVLEWDVANIKATNGNGSTMMHVTKEAMEKRPVAIPPMKEQNKISCLLLGLDDQLTIESTKLATLQQLKKGLMHDLLTGEVRVV